MSNSLDLLCSFNTDYILPSAQQRLLYALLAVCTCGELLIEPAPVGFWIWWSMPAHRCRYRFSPRSSSRSWASLGAVREVIADGIPVWRFENVPAGFTNCPRALDIVKVAIVSAVNALRRDDFCGLVAFAGSARRLAPISPASKTRDLLRGVEHLDKIDLGDDTRLATGCGAGHQGVDGPEVTLPTRRCAADRAVDRRFHAGRNRQRCAGDSKPRPQGYRSAPWGSAATSTKICCWHWPRAAAAMHISSKSQRTFLMPLPMNSGPRSRWRCGGWSSS